jgi:hypothetical protein
VDTPAVIAANATGPAPDGPPIPEVGDLVLIGASPPYGPSNATPVPLPATVLRVHRPGHPESDLMLAVSSSTGPFTLPGAKFAPTLSDSKWSWPTPRRDGRPR